MILTTNTQALVNYSKAADDILALIDDFGFTTDKAFDPLDFKSKIVGAMVSSAQPADEIITVDVEEQEPTEADLEQMLEDLKQEDAQEQLHANECPACGQLVR
jgi:hypothetical protein